MQFKNSNIKAFMNFDPPKSKLNKLPPWGKVPNGYTLYEYLLLELRNNYLEVIKVPAPDAKHNGHGIRMVQSQNTLWYREFTAKYQRTSRKIGRSKSDTVITRRSTVKALNKIIKCENNGMNKKQILDKYKPHTVYLNRIFAFVEHYQ